MKKVLLTLVMAMTLISTTAAFASTYESSWSPISRVRVYKTGNVVIYLSNEHCRDTNPEGQQSGFVGLTTDMSNEALQQIQSLSSAALLSGKSVMIRFTTDGPQCKIEALDII